MNTPFRRSTKRNRAHGGAGHFERTANGLRQFTVIAARRMHGGQTYAKEVRAMAETRRQEDISDWIVIAQDNAVRNPQEPIGPLGVLRAVVEDFK
ncbi:hypothetical protein [Rhizobium sp. LC145]|uniref:hypothetical protein n=1 Tax=Rhizobium sp. LC145 TaxID=1120688 RepID=UPI00062A393E|nr:hypothetical protein [Rhizobium sp. LC145]KKX24325.1 hypothetical protein YH62_27630 [Rhizobium sp. LC145]